jgi:uridine kinase
MTREELLVDLVARVLALPDDRALLVALDGMSCVGKSTLAAELATLLDEAGRPVVRVAYDDFHHPREVRYRQDRLSAEGYLADSYDSTALLDRVLDPARRGAGEIRPASWDLAADEPVSPDAVPVGPGSVVIVEGEFLLSPDFDDGWDLGVLLVADPATVLARAVSRDSDLGTPDQVRELYVRRYLGAWALHEERHDPWRRADVVVDLTDPAQPRRLG